MKYIYLDQNHWISLLKAVKEPDEHKIIYELLRKAIALVISGEICFPISTINIIELAKVGNQEKRKSLSSLMVLLSEGYVVPLPQNCIDDWLKYSIQKHVGFVPNTKPELLPSKGLFGAFPQETREEIKKLALDLKLPLEHIEYFPDIWFKYLSFPDESYRRKAIEEITKLYRKHNEMMKERRSRIKQESEESKHRTYCYLLAHDQMDKIKAICADIGIDHRLILHSSFEKMVKLITRIPFFDVETELHIVSEKQWPRKLQQNDWYDIGALSIAIPCCDFIFTEKYWKSLVIQSAVHSRYNTIIENKIDKLEGVFSNLS